MAIQFVFRRLLPLALAVAGTLLVAAPARAAGDFSALVIDASSGRVLYEYASREQRHPASLTKMMTLYMLFDALQRRRLGLYQGLPVSSEAASRPPSKLALRPGETITVEQAILGLVTHSANDVAVTVGESLGGSEETFARMMTQTARALGMSQTTFRNASGLPNDEQVTSAWDMAKLARALMRDFPQYYRYFSTPRFAFRGRAYRNHNRLLNDYYGTDGIKTGYIRDSGFNLVASANRNGRRLIGVVFGGSTASERNEQMRSLLDQGFAQLGVDSVRMAQQMPAGMSGGYSDAGNFNPTPTRRGGTFAQGAEDDDGDALATRKPQVYQTYKAPPSLPPLAYNSPQAGTGAPGAVYGARSSWQIQLGIFPDFTTAERRANEAIATLTGFAKARIAVMPMLVRGQTLYRSCLQGLAREEAATACNALQQNQIHCILLPPSG